MTNRIRLALDGGTPVRRHPLPPALPGAVFYGKEEVELVTRVVRAQSPFRYYGPNLQHMVDQFETRFARFIDVPHALGVNSGTTALTVAMAVLGIGPGDEVIVPGFMWVSTIGAVVRAGAIPVLADIDATFCLDPRDVARKITSRTRAVIMVHMLGTTGNLRQIVALCRRHRLPLIEDTAQACGATVSGRRLGSFGSISTFSLQLNKTMTTGEGGVVCVRTRDRYRRAFAAHDMGTVRGEKGVLVAAEKYATWGCGGRMSEVTGALALAQLAKLPKICRTMRRHKYRLKQMLADIPGLIFRRVDDPRGDASSFLIVTFPKARHAEFFERAMRAEGIQSFSRMANWGMHIYYNVPSLVLKRPVGGNNPWTDPRNRALVKRSYGKGTLPQCDDLIARSAILPVSPLFTERDLQQVSAAFHKIAVVHPLQ